MGTEERAELWLDFNWTHQDFRDHRANTLLSRLFGMPHREETYCPRVRRQPKRGPWCVVTDLSRSQAVAFVELFKLYGVPELRLEIR